jgi:hypothetical protein
MVEQASAPKRRVRAGWVAMILVLALVGAGCGSKSEPDGQGSTGTSVASEPTTAPVGVPQLDQVALVDALLAEEDIPSRWSDLDPYRETSIGPQGKARFATSWLCSSTGRAASFTPDGAAANVVLGMNFSGSSLGGSVDQSLYSIADAQAQWQRMREAFDSCLGQPWEEGIVTYSLVEAPWPVVGDETRAYRVTQTDVMSGSPMMRTIVLTRRDTVIGLYDGTEGSGDPRYLLRPGELEDLVTKGDQRLEAALAAAEGSTTPSPIPPTVTRPSCDEVQAAIAQMSPADLATLKKAPMLFFSRLPAGDDGWRITALGDVTGTAPRPDVVVFYDWTPSSGLGPPVVVLDPDDLEVLQGDETSVTLIGMNCINATVNVNP